MSSEVFLLNSTFLLLMLKDVRMPQILIRLSNQMNLVTTAQVIEEVRRKLRRVGHEDMASAICRASIRLYNPLSNTRILDGNPIIIHRPFLGLGEFSLFLLFWYLWYKQGVQNIFIVTDDKSARKYVAQYIDCIPEERLLWSLKFLDLFAVSRGIITVDEFKEIIMRIERSGFWVSRRIPGFL